MANFTHPAQHVIVIGAGVVGLASAWWLLEAGCRVTVVEQAESVGSGCSYRNGGQLSYRYVSPLADAGVPWKALQWLWQPDGPLRFRLEADPRQWRWLARFLASCNAGANRRTTATLLQLGELSRNAMAQLALAVPLQEFAWRNAGKLVVYRSRSLFDAVVSRADVIPDPDNTRQVLSPAEIVQREPALSGLSPQLAGGIFDDGEAVADCHAFCLALAQRLLLHPRFDGIVRAEVRQLQVRQGRIGALLTSSGSLHADRYVLAAGISSRHLAKTAGIYLPVYPLKGYSLTAPIRPGDAAPAVSVTDFERKILYARIGGNLRVAGMADLVGENTAIDPRRITSLLRLACATLPRAADYDRAESWAGLRPATPHGAPIVGATRYPNLWLNVGHGALGFTFACGAAVLLADLMQGKSVALEGLALSR
ncbi:FAD-dependent oxidoreductase [Duganella sp. FT92W]|uniref:FAD-dependent oxidoreductase n=1 Tax=Pseudoduganella rivuli TaxID=2666085 RepID=A0A7X2LRJ8_9BURK|nr:D-amino acid dehydrogenase [Pseudoduganella rivuli]MRV70893.1 FAD-dependent oxidoreductase [Pseudoduganella rivuli]